MLKWTDSELAIKNNPIILFQDEHLHKSTFDPLAQHRDWCPWISVGKENMDPGAMDGNGARHQQGWKAALDFLMPMKKNANSAGNSPSQASQHFTPNLENIAWGYTSHHAW